MNGLGNCLTVSSLGVSLLRFQGSFVSLVPPPLIHSLISELTVDQLRTASVSQYDQDKSPVSNAVFAESLWFLTLIK